jgi:alpha/beta superfamily hydrolase
METFTDNPSVFPLNDAHFFITGDVGRLEIISSAAKERAKGVAVICHPHPLYQGTMTNKVVHTLSRAFHEQDLHTVRFNFRGVGKSEGTFGHSEGEVADLLAVLKWVDTVLPQAKLWLAGFSFGAYIAVRGALNHSCCQLYTVAPAVNHQPYDELPVITCPWIVIQGEQDEVISPELVYAWYARTQIPTMQLFKLPEASHFFHGNLIALRDLVGKTFSESC